MSGLSFQAISICRSRPSPIPTAGIDRRFIDHIAMSKDLRADSMQFVSRFDADGTELSDHNGVFMVIQNR